MTTGPGKYDALATYVREATRARAVLVAVIDGYAGSGFSVQAEGEPVANDLPRLLRFIADGIEAENATKQ